MSDFIVRVEIDGVTLSFKDKNGLSIGNDDLIGTGTTIAVQNGTESDSYTYILYGDVNGDGIIDISDLTSIKLHLLKSDSLSGIYLKSGSIYTENSITINGLLAIKKQILNIGIINQNH